MESSTEPAVDVHNYRIAKDQSVETFDDCGIHRGSFGFDSGYTSNTSIVTTLSDASSNVTSYRSSLEPINEDVELHSFSGTPILTPTSRNVRLIDAFHITTPEGEAAAAAASPAKLNDHSRNRFCDLTPTKLQSMRRALYKTPTKRSPLKPRQDTFQNILSRQNAFDFNNEDIENASFADKIPLSPFNSSKSNSSILLENHRQFERKLSENSLQSSTPITRTIAPSQLNTIGAVPKFKYSSLSSPKTNNIFRKTQSFSPSKYFQQLHDGTKSSEDIVLDLPTNPAKQLLDFSPRKFNQLFDETNNSCTERLLASGLTDSISNSTRPLARLDELNEDIDDQIPKIENTNQCQDEVSEDILTPLPKIQKAKRKLIDLTPTPTPITTTTTQPVPIQTNLLRTPKRIRRSVSLNTDPVKETNLILYSHLPCTPPKSRRRHLKRMSTAAAVSKKTEASPAKRKLYETPTSKVPQKRFSYDGIKRLDILRHLSETMPAIDLILNYLSGDDLANAYAVSRCWQRIILQNSKANSRRKKSVRDQAVNNENIFDTEMDPEFMMIPHSTGKNRTPFNPCNGMVTRRMGSEIHQRNQCSPLISPSKRRFYENQKLIQKLEKYTKFRKCPRCGSSSIIQTDNGIDTNFTSATSNAVSASETTTPMKLRSSKSVEANMFPFQKQYSFSFDIDCDISSLIQHSTPDAVPSKSLALSAITSSLSGNQCNDGGYFAQCTANNCNFKFCVKCLCAYSVNHLCLISSTGSKASLNNKDTVKIPVSGTKRSKRNLRRLCTIDKM